MYGRVCKVAKAKPVRADIPVTNSTLLDKQMTSAERVKDTMLNKNTFLEPNVHTSRFMINEKKVEVAHCRNSPRLPIRIPGETESKIIILEDHKRHKHSHFQTDNSILKQWHQSKTRVTAKKRSQTCKQENYLLGKSLSK